MRHLADFFSDGLERPSTGQSLHSDLSGPLNIIHEVKCFCYGLCGNEHTVIGHHQDLLSTHNACNPGACASIVLLE